MRRFLLPPLALAATLLAPSAAHAYDVTIVAPGDPRGLSNNTGAPFFASVGPDSTVPADLIEAELNAGRNVTIDGASGPGVAVIAAPITGTTGSASLQIYAETAVQVQAPVAVGGDLLLTTGSIPDDPTGVEVDDRLRAGRTRTVSLSGNVVRSSGTGRVDAGTLEVVAARTVSLTGGNDVGVVSLFAGATAAVRTVGDVRVTGQTFGALTVDAVGNATVEDVDAGGDLAVRARGTIDVAADAVVRASGALRLVPAFDDASGAPDPTASSGVVRLGASSALEAPGGIGLWVKDEDGLAVASSARLNGEPYVPGPIGVDSSTARWGAPYGAVGTPYLVTYAVGEPLDPVVTLDAPVDGAEYAAGAAVTAEYACAAGTRGSAIASCDGDVPTGSPLDTATPGEHTFTVTAVNAAGRTTTVTRRYRVLPTPATDAPPAPTPTVPAAPAGAAPTPAVPARPDTTAPRVTDLRHTRRMVRLRVDERASVAVTVERRVVRVTRVGGRRVVRRSWEFVRTVTLRQAGPGLATTRLRTRPFRGRRYRVTAVATDAAGNRSRPVRIVGGV